MDSCGTISRSLQGILPVGVLPGKIYVRMKSLSEIPISLCYLNLKAVQTSDPGFQQLTMAGSLPWVTGVILSPSPANPTETAGSGPSVFSSLGMARGLL